MKTLCATGHRPKDLPWNKNDLSDKRRLCYLDKMREIIVSCIADGYTHFISGAALGVDTDFALTVLNLKENYPFIRLELAIPCREQNKFWTEKESEIYLVLQNKADKVTVLSELYTPYCMQKRNEYMVDKSDAVLCCYNGAKSGGTYNTIKYAKRKNKPLFIIDLSPLFTLI